MCELCVAERYSIIGTEQREEKSQRGRMCADVVAIMTALWSLRENIPSIDLPDQASTSSSTIDIFIELYSKFSAGTSLGTGRHT